MNKNYQELPQISIVIPVLNMEKTIGRTIGSVAKQKYPDFELIIQDGGSKDKTVDIIKKYARKYPRIISWKSEKDRGQFEALERGFRKAKGEILSFINGDDYYQKDTLQKVGKAFWENKKTMWVAGRGIVVDEKGHEIAHWVTLYKNILLRLNNYKLLLLVNYMMQPSVFFTRKAYKKYGPITGDKIHIREFDLWYKLGKIKMPVVINECLSNYSVFPGVGSALYYDTIRRDDYKITKKYTKNWFILTLRYFHNWARVIVYKLFYSRWKESSPRKISMMKYTGVIP